MSILTSMHTGISGLQATGQNLGIIGDNIANAGTIAYKMSRGEFQDVVASNLKGILGGNQIGQGSHLGGVTSVYTQGNLTPTERDADMAIKGDGFFVLKGGQGEVSYTRDGSFRFDAKGRLQTVDHQLVQGYKFNEDGKPGSELGDIQFNSNTIPATGTKTIKIDSNMDTRKSINLLGFTPDTAEKTSDYSTAIRIYDSTGTARSLSLYFYKTAESEWTWHATSDGGALAGGVEGIPQEVATGKLTFTKDGKLNTDEVLMSNLSFKGAEPNQKIDFNFGDAIVTRKGTGMQGTTQYGSQTQVYRQIQDGFAAGTLTNFSVDERGVVSGSYSNGTTKPLAQIALARFENNEGLYKVGGNRYKEATLSGQPLVGEAGLAGRGTIASKSLEASNVDLANEFVKMIQTQRNFQANAKTITTSDEMLTDIINLKR